VQEPTSEPKLFPYLCQQRQYLSENQIMQVAKQLLDLLVFTHSLGISHGNLSSECIHVLYIDPLNIEITVSGYQHACLETIGLSSSLSPISI
jgi:serine/threonine protein kinase